MWKTRFEVVDTSHCRRNRSSSFVHQYYSGPLPTVPRVREDSPSAIVRSSPPSSMSNLDILPEEDEDIPCANAIHNEQSNSLSITVTKQNSSQNLKKHQFILPTIVESNDHEIIIENEQYDNRVLDVGSYDDKLTRQDPFVATNTNYNQVINVDMEKRQERTFNTNKKNEMIELALDKHMNELLKQRNSKQTKVRQILLRFATSIHQ